MRTLIGLALFTLCATVTPARAQWTSSRPDGHAPLGVMMDHRHEAGEVMLSYRFMYMWMEESRDGSDLVADPEIVSPDGPYEYLVTPTRMPKRMHVAGLMYAPADQVTLVAMLPYLDTSMEHLMRNGNQFTTSSSGLGDLTVGAMIGLARFGRQTIHANLTLRIPTGSIDETDQTPASAPDEAVLPYPMQPGTGSWALPVGLTYLGQTDSWSWGGQGMATFQLDSNDRHYEVGNRYQGTIWGARRLGSHFSVSVRAAASRVQNITGADPALNPAAVPTADPDLRAGTRVDAGIGVNLSLPQARGLRFAIEGLRPMYQNLDGPQLESDWMIVAGVQLVPIK